MSFTARTTLILLFSALCTVSVAAQSASNPISLDVVVAPKAGAPVSGLQQADFAVLDNKVPQKILSFQALGGTKEPIEVTIVVDDVNIGIDNMNYERQQVDKFLLAGKGPFDYPTTLVVVTDTHTKIEDSFTTDREVLSGWLDKSDITKRVFERGGLYQNVERLNISLAALRQIISLETRLPGRKLVLWISPGWSLINTPGMMLSSKQEKQIFGDITSLTTEMVQGHITLDAIDPLGSQDVGGSATTFANPSRTVGGDSMVAEGARSFMWRQWLKPVPKPGDAQFGNLALQVFATQSGGLTLNSSNDTGAMLQQCLADTQAYYEISFEPPAGGKPEELHNLEVRVAKSDLIARTRWEYYTPAPAGKH